MTQIVGDIGYYMDVDWAEGRMKVYNLYNTRYRYVKVLK